jgi:hypothetical protein
MGRKFKNESAVGGSAETPNPAVVESTDNAIEAVSEAMPALDAEKSVDDNVAEVARKNMVRCVLRRDWTSAGKTLPAGTEVGMILMPPEMNHNTLARLIADNKVSCEE